MLNRFCTILLLFISFQLSVFSQEKKKDVTAPETPKEQKVEQKQRGKLYSIPQFWHETKLFVKQPTKWKSNDWLRMFEPGRSLVGNTGILLARVEYLKHGEHRNFAVIDAAMNDLIRPALYDAWHDIQPVQPRRAPARRYEVVGPVCESGDFLGHDRDLSLAEGDLVAIMSAGAYGMTMSSNYNTRPRAAEVMVSGSAMHLIREREEVSQLIALERVLP